MTDPAETPQIPRHSLPKDRFIYTMLGLFIGVFGVHNFFAGRKKSAFIQLLLGILWIFLLSFPVAKWTGCSEETCNTWTIAIFSVGLLWVYLEVFLVQRDGNGNYMDDPARPARILLAILVLVAFVILPALLYFYQSYLDRKQQDQGGNIQTETLSHMQ